MLCFPDDVNEQDVNDLLHDINELRDSALYLKHLTAAQKVFAKARGSEMETSVLVIEDIGNTIVTPLICQHLAEEMSALRSGILGDIVTMTKAISDKLNNPQ